jgi:plasmid stabilization system protein ParE
MSEYVIGAEAEADLAEIWDYIAKDSVTAANRWLEKLFEAFEFLARTPGAGHKREDLTYHPVLFWPVGSYSVLYRTQAQRVEIVAVTQGARDIPKFLTQRFED